MRLIVAFGPEDDNDSLSENEPHSSWLPQELSCVTLLVVETKEIRVEDSHVGNSRVHLRFVDIVFLLTECM